MEFHDCYWCGDDCSCGAYFETDCHGCGACDGEDDYFFGGDDYFDGDDNCDDYY
jgi:hypothetical protein